MNEFTPLTLNQIYTAIGGTIVGVAMLVGSLLLKDWIASVVANFRAKKNGGSGEAILAKTNGNFNEKMNAVISAQNETKQAVVDGFGDLTKVLASGFDRICGKVDGVKEDTKAIRKIVEVTDDDLVPRVHNKPMVEKLIRKVAAKLGVGVN